MTHLLNRANESIDDSIPRRVWWDSLKKDITAQTRVYCKEKRKSQRLEKNKLTRQLIKKKHRLYNNLPHSKDKIKELERRISALTQEEIKGSIIRTLLTENGERPTAFFFRQER